MIPYVKKIKDDNKKFNKSIEGWDYYQFVLLKVQLRKEPIHYSQDSGYFKIYSQSGFAGDHMNKKTKVDEDADFKNSFSVHFEWGNSKSQERAWEKALSIFKRLCYENDLIITEYDDRFCGLWKYTRE